ncbi:hypothetical protein SAMN05444487_105176 [Marininema mesophilum]|uniref:Uncharacterized protein n=1 Tax=Marininema mesophilum TaxID=1048340 RepID=A0A1H2VQ86_9BACL|nr:hypothetical protein SAMN05444487_105176 [Marininema mesophilum]
MFFAKRGNVEKTCLKCCMKESAESNMELEHKQLTIGIKGRFCKIL